MSPPRRRVPPAAGRGARRAAGARGAGSARRSAALGALSREDLEALLSQLDVAAAGPGRGSGRSGGARELDRLRRVLAAAIADAGQGEREPVGHQSDDAVAAAGWWDGEDGDDDEEEELWRPGETWDESDAWDAGVTREEELADEDGRWSTWAARRRWERFESSGPIPVEGGLVAKTRRGPIGSTWWSKRFLGAVEAVLVGGRLERGRSYARRGQVIDLAVSPGLIEAQVQGSRTTPYRVRLAMPVVPDDGWDRIVTALAAQAGHAARMLAGELPHEVEDVFSAEGASLFPGPGGRLTTDCTCPDWANPCKHVAAVCYLVAEEFDRDPFAVLAWRGRDRDAVLAALRRLRSGAGEVHGAPAFTGAPGAVGPSAPPLDQCLLGYWKAGPQLADVRVRPDAAALPAAVLRPLATGLIEVRGRDIGELLAPAFAEIAAAAARRALGADDVGRTQGRRTALPTRS